MEPLPDPSSTFDATVTLVRDALLVPPPADRRPFPLVAGRASPPQRGGAVHRRRGDWHPIPEAQHRRIGRSATRPLEEWAVPSRPRDVPERIDDGVYLGVALDHFGHFLSESIHRLWAMRDARVPERSIGVMLVPGDRRAPLPFHLEVLDALGIARDRIRWMRDPVRVRRLRVPALAARLGEPVDPAYARWLRRLTAETLGLGASPPAGDVYLHKPLDHGRGVTIGAAHLAEALDQQGVRTIVPERLPLLEQLRVVATASRVIADQGSALHLLDLLGGIDGAVTMLARPDNALYLRDDGPRRSPDWRTAECVRPLPPPGGIPADVWRFTSVSRFDRSALEAVLRARLDRPIAIDAVALRRAEQADLDAWQRTAPALYRDADAVRASLPAWRQAVDPTRRSASSVGAH